MRFIYTHPDDGLVRLAIAAPKAHLERMTGAPISDADYRAHILRKLIPDGAGDVTEVPDDFTLPRGDRSRLRIVDGAIHIAEAD